MKIYAKAKDLLHHTAYRDTTGYRPGIQEQTGGEQEFNNELELPTFFKETQPSEKDHGPN